MLVVFIRAVLLYFLVIYMLMSFSFHDFYKYFYTTSYHFCTVLPLIYANVPVLPLFFCIQSSFSQSRNRLHERLPSTSRLWDRKYTASVRFCSTEISYKYKSHEKHIPPLRKQSLASLHSQAPGWIPPVHP